MLIQPSQPVPIIIKLKEKLIHSNMMSLTETELELNCTCYLDKNSRVQFIGQYFRGHGQITAIRFTHMNFHYTLRIESIHFQPGLLINTWL